MHKSMNISMTTSTKLTRIFVLILSLLVAIPSFATTLTENEKKQIAEKLEPLPITRRLIWSILFPENSDLSLEVDFQNELENLLKTSLLETDTQLIKLTPGLRRELSLDRTIAAFHKQGSIPFEITLSRSGSFQENKTNDTVRQLENTRYFTHEHNIFVADAELSRDVNTVILLFHELSHAAFDHMLAKNPERFAAHFAPSLPKTEIKKLLRRSNGKLKIDGDLYDLFSERFAFELEYRLDRKISSLVDTWPSFYRFEGVTEDEYINLIDGFVRRVYNIDHPALENVPAYPLDLLVMNEHE